MNDAFPLHPLLLEQEVQRSLALANLTWAGERQTYARFGLRAGMHILELGSGVGAVTERLLADLPNSTITTIEPHVLLNQRARERLGQYGSRWHALDPATDLANLPVSTFDAVLARYAFQKLPDPVAVARDVSRVLQPGGTLIITDLDEEVWGVADPPIPFMDQARQERIAFQRGDHGNCLIGRHLWRILHQAGFSDIQHETVIVHSDMVGLEPFRALLAPDDTARQLLAQAGLMPPTSGPDIRSIFAEWAAQPAAFVLLQLFCATGTKSAKCT